MESKRAQTSGTTSTSTSSSSGESSGCGSPASPNSGGSSPAPTATKAPAVVAVAAAPAPAPPPGGNVFANDGSFMEMFKKKMEEEERRRKEAQQRTGGEEARATEQGQTSVEKKPPPVTSFVRGLASFLFIGIGPSARAPVTVSVFYPLTQVGKRRGGVFLKTGMVAKKQKHDTEVEPGKSDAWSKYMAEVKKYKAHQCGDDDKTRPLVK
ncbi:telomerase RNA component interacting RNase isoform X1 [Larimichthys crocea]|uniref:telomerase RNA component interacting RNase isoform X1 n=1 Tax=Larimichthys crocea TaxID=215358 RepID=UPI000F5E5B54|nr:telomerase RNA component interacting RNase isoform X1 [Larimichthys crocea]